MRLVHYGRLHLFFLFEIEVSNLLDCDKLCVSRAQVGGKNPAKESQKRNAVATLAAGITKALHTLPYLTLPYLTTLKQDEQESAISIFLCFLC